MAKGFRSGLDVDIQEKLNGSRWIDLDIDSANKYLYSGGTAVQNVGEGTYSFVFTPTGTTTTLWLEVGGGTQVTTDFDDISLEFRD